HFSASQRMTEFQPVTKVDFIREGAGRAFPVNGRMVAIFLKDGVYYAMDDFCPHMGASLAGGSFEDDIVTCPWHAWRFCVKDGTWCDNPRLKVDTFEIRIEGDDILVCVPPKESKK